MELFSYSYFWSYFVCILFSFLAVRAAKNFNGTALYMQFLMNMAGTIGYIACFAFIAMVFFGDIWWYGLILIGASFISGLIPIPDWIGGILGIVIVPISAVLMFILYF